MRILVTGVSGQVGGALLQRLRTHDVVAAGRVVLDLTKPDGIAGVLDALEPDLIINPAAYTAVDKAEDERDLAYLVNAIAPGIMAAWAATREVPLVHLSTDYVFDGSGERPWRESDATGPLSVYGASKLAGENAIRACSGSALIVRTSWVYAAEGTNFLRTIVRLARERKELRVVADQEGAPTSAAVIADALVAMVGDTTENFRAQCALSEGVVHLTAAAVTSWYGFALAIVEGLRRRGVPLAVERLHAIASEDFPTRAARPRNSRLDLSRLRQVFGVVPMSWEQALNAELDQLVGTSLPQS